jgi:hypothetical protein
VTTRISISPAREPRDEGGPVSRIVTGLPVSASAWGAVSGENSRSPALASSPWEPVTLLLELSSK